MSYFPFCYLLFSSPEFFAAIFLRYKRQRIEANCIFRIIRREVRITHRYPDVGMPENTLQHDHLSPGHY